MPTIEMKACKCGNCGAKYIGSADGLCAFCIVRATAQGKRVSK